MRLEEARANRAEVSEAGEVREERWRVCVEREDRVEQAWVVVVEESWRDCWRRVMRVEFGGRVAIVLVVFDFLCFVFDVVFGVAMSREIVTLPNSALTVISKSMRL